MGRSVYFSNIMPQTQAISTAKANRLELGSKNRKISYTYRFLIITGGNCTILLDNRAQLCKNGDLIFLCPHQEYTTIFETLDFVCVNIVFGFAYDFSDKPYANISIKRMLHPVDIQPTPDYYAEKLNFIDLDIFNSSFITTGMPGAESFAVKMYDMYCDNNKLTRLRLNAELLGFISDLFEYVSGDSLRVRVVTARRILGYIDDHCNEHLTCAMLSERFNYHSSYINRIIRSYTGYSAHVCITRAKVKAATRLLLETDRSVTDIAYHLSFCDSSHFCKVYREYTGVKPTDVRCKK